MSELKPVESSNIAAVGQSAPNAEDKTATLTIRFHNGATYDYAAVPLETIEEFITAESVGKAFFSMIRANFKGVRRVESE